MTLAHFYLASSGRGGLMTDLYGAEHGDESAAGQDRSEDAEGFDGRIVLVVEDVEDSEAGADAHQQEADRDDEDYQLPEEVLLCSSHYSDVQ